MSKTELALTAATQAVAHDAAGRAQEAIYYYELSVELLQGEPLQPGSPFIEKMNEYSARAAFLRSTTPIAVVRVSSQPAPKEIHEEDKSPLGVAVSTAEKAVEADNAGKYREALLLYIEACGMFTQLLRSPEVPEDMKSVMRERLSAYTIRTEIVERLQQAQTKQTYKQPPPAAQPPLYPSSQPLAQPAPPHPYLTQAQYAPAQQPPAQYAYPAQQQPIFNPSASTPSTYNPATTPVQNPVPFGMQPGQTRYVDPLHRPTLFERLKKLGL
eukprot:Phypoly_transcript_12384.p1 GENE.Phypoly_transcript_12384~~Phypoly_transcript_12384.p1  ORF type:complete len:270 (+),score=83.19 Phypoly_transcript_12384:72-881(+)